MANTLGCCYYLFPIFGSGKYKWQPIYVKDVAKAFVKAINNKKCYNKIFEIGGLKRYRFIDLIKNQQYMFVCKLNLKYVFKQIS